MLSSAFDGVPTVMNVMSDCRIASSLFVTIFRFPLFIVFCSISLRLSS